MTEAEAEAARAAMMDQVALIERQVARGSLDYWCVTNEGPDTAEAVLCGLAAGGGTMREAEAALILLARVNPYRAACAWLAIRAEAENTAGWRRLRSAALLARD